MFKAADAVVSGIEGMINAAIYSINGFSSSVNSALAKIPGNIQIGILPNVDLGSVSDPFDGAFSDAGDSAASAFNDAFSKTYFDTPNLGLDAAISDADAVVAAYKEAKAARDKLQEASLSAGYEGSFPAAGSLVLGDGDLKNKKTKTSKPAALSALQQYSKDARDTAKQIQDSLVGAFKSAENAVGDFVKTGKFNFSSFATSVLADLAMIATRKLTLGPLASLISGAFGGAGKGITAGVFHAGGMVGSGGVSRSISPMAFAGAPRFHSGGMVGLAPDEVPAILQKGERVLSRAQVANGLGGGGASVVRVELGQGLVAAILQQSQAQAVQLVQSALQSYDRNIAPKTVSRVLNDVRRIG